jgi:hypothetical protein
LSEPFEVIATDVRTFTSAASALTAAIVYGIKRLAARRTASAPAPAAAA